MFDADQALGRGVARVFRWSARHAKLVVVAYLIATVAFAYGLQFIEVRSTDYDLMPDSHPSTLANERALNKIPGYRNVETLWLETSDVPTCTTGPSGTTCARDNITSERAIRGAEEAQIYIRSRIPELNYVISLPNLVKLINYTASGSPDPACSVAPSPGILPNGSFDTCAPVKAPDIAALNLPNDTLTFQRDMDILTTAAPDTIAAQTNDTYTGAFIIFIYDINVTKQGPGAIIPLAAKFEHVAQEWRDQGCPNMQAKDAQGSGPVFNCSKTYVLGQSINGHMTELAQQDFRTWGPIVFGVTFLVLVIAFSDVVSMLIAFASFCMGLVWTYGLMGYMHIPLTFFGLLIVPITMGVGKEYAIYVTNQYMEYVADGRSREETWGMVGRRAGGALAIATITSLAGLLAMFLAGFHVMRDLAFLCCFAFGSLFLLAITFIPAAQSLRRRTVKPKPYKPSHMMGGVARFVQENRALVIVVTVAATAALAFEATHIQEYFGISGGFRQGDYVEQSYRYYNDALGGSGTELVVVEGDIADPKTLDYLTALDNSLVSDKEHIPKASNVNSFMLGLRTYFDLKDGITNPGILKEKTGKDPNVNIPRDPALIRAAIHDMYNSTVWSPLVAIFVSPDADFAVTHAFYHIASEDHKGLRDDWNALNADVSNDKVPRPDTVKRVDLVGTQDTFYLFVEYGLPWLTNVGYIASGLTLVIAFLVLRRLRDVMAIVVPMMLAGIWWLGLLPLFGIKASMTLMLPTVMLISIGSDYAIQYVWNHREVGDMEEVYRTTGKANLFVVIATVVAFLLFVPMQLVLSSQGALAAALAIGAIFVSTTIVVPLFYPGAATEPADENVVVEDESATHGISR